MEIMGTDSYEDFYEGTERGDKMRLGKRIVVSLLIMLLAAAFSGCAEHLEEEYQKARESIVADADSYVSNWLAENEPGAVLQTPLKAMGLSNYIQIDHVQSDCAFVRAVTGTYLRNDEEVKFVYLEEFSDEADSSGKPGLYVSKLPEKQSQEILQELCKDLSVSHRAVGLEAGSEIVLPVWCQYMRTGYSRYYAIPLRTQKDSPYSIRRIPADLSAETLDDKVPGIPISDASLGHTPAVDNMNSERYRANRIYLESTWRYHLRVFIELTGTGFSENEEALLSWIRSAGISEAVFTDGKENDRWEIRHSYVPGTGNGGDLTGRYTISRMDPEGVVLETVGQFDDQTLEPVRTEDGGTKE